MHAHSPHHPWDWDPQSPTCENPVATTDDLRRRCPAARSEEMGWSLLRHADVVRALEEPATFSSSVSSHLNVPNGLDSPKHTRYRRAIDPFFSPQRMATLEPRMRVLARELVASLPQGDIDVIARLADEFSFQAQCTFLDWPVELHRPLREWVRRNHAATRSRDRARMEAVAFEFDRHIRAELDARRRSGLGGHDITSELLRTRIGERTLTDEEIVSILRNWTVGELATISACIGIVIGFLVQHPDIQANFRASPRLLDSGIDEILRIESPFMASRRVTRRAVDIAGRRIAANERVTLMWGAANRDETVFDQPGEFRLDRNPRLNLLYGAGIHVCPGAPLARVELRVLMEEALAALEFVPARDTTPVRAAYPASGFSKYVVRICRIGRPSGPTAKVTTEAEPQPGFERTCSS